MENRHLRTLAGELAEQLPEQRSRALQVLRYMKEHVRGAGGPRLLIAAAAIVVAAGAKLAIYGPGAVEAHVVGFVDDRINEAIGTHQRTETFERIMVLRTGEAYWIRAVRREGDPFGMSHVVDYKHVAGDELVLTAKAVSAGY
jgi:hypothetical protein